MPAYRLFAVMIGFLLGAFSVAAGPPTHLESFDTTTYKNATETTADWNTSAGELRAFPYSPTLVGTAPLSEARCVVVKGNLAFVVDEFDGLLVMDITNPANPVGIGGYNPAGNTYGVAVSGDIAVLVGTTSSLEVLSISDPTNPTPIGTTNEYGLGVTIVGDLAFVADWSLGLRVINITNPTSPTLVGQYNVQYGYAVAVTGNLAILATQGNGLYFIDITNPTNPSPLAVGSSSSSDLAVDGNFLFVADNSAGLLIFDMTGVFSFVPPTLVGEYATLGNAFSVGVAGDVAFVADNTSGLHVIDVSDPASPMLVGMYDTPGIPYDLAVEGETVYLADDAAGLQAVRVATRSVPAQLGSYGLAATGFVYDVDVAGNHAYVAHDVAGLRVFDISNPSSPVLTGTYNSVGSARGVAVEGGIAFLADASAVRIIDVTNPASPTLLGSRASSNAFDIAVAGDIAVVASGGVQVLDVSNLSNPTQIGTCSTGGALGIALDGDYAYVAAHFAGFVVVSVANPAAPVVVGSYNTPGTGYDVDIEGDVAYFADEGGGLLVFDIADPSTPTLLATFPTGHAALGIAVEGDLAYVADWGAGLTVIDVSTPASPIKLGSVDTPVSARRVAVAGEIAFLTDSQSGLHVFSALNHLVNPAVGRSLAVDNGTDVILKARLSDNETPGISWQASSDAGTSWSSLVSNNTWTSLANPGSDLVWRSTLSWAGLMPTVSDLTLQWLYHFPVIDNVKDIANDQGKQVRVEWTRSGHDFVGDASQIVEYAVYRRIDYDLAIAATAAARGLDDLSPAAREHALAMQAAGWDFLVTVPVRVEDHYAVVVPTLKDSTIAEGMYRTSFRVTALTATPGIFFDSPPDSGYSLDNLAPAVPANIVAAHNTGNGNTLSWDEAEEIDFAYYRIYRSNAPDFDPSPGTLVHSTVSNQWIDPDYDEGTVFYKISATDFSGNESAAGSPGTITAVPNGSVPEAFTLHQNFPNPFNPTTSIRYDVPRGGAKMTLRVFDVAGHSVRTLVSGFQTEGRKELSWDGRDDRGHAVATGPYFCRLTGPGFAQSRKMVLLK